VRVVAPTPGVGASHGDGENAEMHHLAQFALLAACGGAGALLRAGLTSAVSRWLGDGFPWGTLLVNVGGSFTFGAIAGLARSRGGLPAGLEMPLLVGLLGGFTTYSSFAFQAVELLERGRAAAAGGYVVATNVLAIVAAWAGMRAFTS